jgi:3-oxocholest-4-en-26-oate---CoA ligase
LHRRGSLTIIDVIASSEGGPFAFAVTKSESDMPARFFLVATAKVVSQDDTDVVAGSGQSGVLAYSGPMPRGYYKDSRKTEHTFRTIDGVRHAIPGDLAEVKSDGSIRFLGRGSGVINTGGEKVHPQEIEDVLLAHPDVMDAVVIGVPDDLWGERVAAIVATVVETLTAQDLKDTVRDRLAGYKVPRDVSGLLHTNRTHDHARSNRRRCP